MTNEEAIAHPRQLKCVIIARVSLTHKYNDLQLSKLLATNEINRVPPEFEIIWNGSWWEMIHLSCYLWNSTTEMYLPGLSHCSSYPVALVGEAGPRAPAPAPGGLRAAGGAGWEPPVLFTSVGVPAIIFFQETLMCLKVRLIPI